MLQRRALGAGVLGLAMAGAGLAARTGAAAPMRDYPSRPVTIVVPWPAGGSTDAVARILAQRLATELGQPFPVDNRTGATGTIGAASVARAKPDGHTLLLTSASTVVMAPHLIQTPYDNTRAFAGVGVVASMPFVLVVPKTSPVRSLGDLVALARQPGSRIVYANAGAGSSAHLTTELFLQQAGIEIPEVGYRGGGPAIQAVMSDEAQLTFLPSANVLPQIQSGDVRAIAVTSRERDPFLPEVPTVREAGFPEYEVVEQLVLLAPAGTPEPILRRLNAAVAAAMAAPETRERLQSLVVAPAVGSVDEFPAWFRAENARWQEVIRSRNIRVQ